MPTLRDQKVFLFICAKLMEKKILLLGHSVDNYPADDVSAKNYFHTND